MTANNTYETRAVSLRERIVNSLLILLFLPVFLLVIPLGLLDKVGHVPSAIAIGWGIVCYSIAVHFAWKTFRKKEVAELVPAEKTPEQMQAEKAAAEEVERKEREFYGKWWVRYSIGIGLLWGAGYLYEANPDKWILPLMMALLGMLAFSELLLIGIGIVVIGIGIGVIWLFVQGVASLPVSLAIVLGAIIIASAISNKN